MSPSIVIYTPIEESRSARKEAKKRLEFNCGRRGVIDTILAADNISSEERLRLQKELEVLNSRIVRDEQIDPSYF